MARCAVCDKGAHFGIKAANGGVHKMYVCTSCLKSGKVERA